MENKTLIKKIKFLHFRELYLFNCSLKFKNENFLIHKDILNNLYKYLLKVSFRDLKNVADSFLNSYKKQNIIFNDYEIDNIIKIIKSFYEFIERTEKDITRHFYYDMIENKVKYKFEINSKNLTEKDINSIKETEIKIFNSIEILKNELDR